MNRAQEEITLDGPFDVKITRRSQVVDIEYENGNKVYAIQYADGGYYGQKWEGDTKTYPTWKKKGWAQRKLAKLKNGNAKCL